MVVTITGASGFVGQHLVPYLSRRHKTIKPVSLRDKNETAWVKHTDAVVHLAGLAHDLKKTRLSDDYDKINTDLTIRLYHQFLADDKAKLFLFISSIKALTDHSEEWLTEQMEPAPTTPYGKSKQKAESYIIEHLPADKKVIILRPCMIHGPGNKGNLNLLFQFVQRGMPWPLGAFENKRSFLTVENLCFAINAILDHPISSGVYHIADSEPVSTNEIIQLMGSSLNRKVSIWKIPRTLIKGLARVGDVLKLPFNTERLEKLTENYLVSNQKLVRAIGQELPVQAFEGLKTTLVSFK